MTPNDIATDVTTFQNGGSINTMTNFTYTFAGTASQRVDDSNTFG